MPQVTLQDRLRAIWKAPFWRRRLLIGLLLLGLALVPAPVSVTLINDFQVAASAAQRQDYAAAANAADDAAQRLPYSAYAVSQAGLYAAAAGRYATALKWLEASAVLDGWTPAKRIALGDIYLNQGDRAAALAQWELVLKDSPDNIAVLERLAQHYEAADRYPDAINALAELARLKPNDADIAYRLALLTAVTTPVQASARLLAVSVLSPDYTDKAKALIEAIEAGQQAHDEAYTFGRVGFVLIQFKEWALAELALTRAVTLNPEYADAYAYLGFAQDMQQKDGYGAYTTAVKLAPDSPLINFLFGQHWRRAGNTSAAIERLTRAQTLAPDNPAIAAELGGAYADTRDLASAEVWLTKAVSMVPQNADFWLLLARFYTDNAYHLNEYGLPAARQAAGLAPNSAAAVDQLGYALFLAGDAINGEKTIERALTLDPNLASAYYHMGLVYAQQGKTEAAIKALNHTMVLDPNGRYGGLALKALSQLTP